MSSGDMPQVTVPIKGMHCRSCEITLTDKFESLASVKKADVSLKNKSATLYGKHLPSEETIERIVESAGYTVGIEKEPWINKNAAVYKDVAIGAVLIVILGLFLGYSGITNIVGTGNLNSGGIYMALVVGLTAGLSTCMALVGGLVLGLSAKYAEKHPTATTAQKFRPHLFFNIGRIVTFFVLGGLIGMAGSAFQLQGNVLGLLTIAVGLVMLMLGLQLTNVFPRLSNGGLTLPPTLAKWLRVSERRDREYSHTNSLVLGAASFFLPCGFTQAMQLYAISTGSFVTGSLVMGLFAIGTAPGLLGVGALTSSFSGDKAKRFFRIVGVAVVAMAFVNLNNGFNLTGLQNPLNGAVDKIGGFFAKDENAAPASETSSDYVLKAKYAVASGMIPKEFTVKAGQSYVLEVDPLEDGVGCMSTVLIPRLNNDIQYLEKGKLVSLPFKADNPGTYKITCAMGVPHATLNVIKG